MKAYGWLVAFGWGLNFAWEMAHSFLYRGVPPFLEHLPFLFIAAVGDSAITVALILLVALGLRDRFWFLGQLSRGLLFLVVISTLASGAIEIVNYSVLDRWQYTPAMPRVPALAVGLTPFLQVTLLPAFTALLTSARCRN